MDIYTSGQDTVPYAVNPGLGAATREEPAARSEAFASPAAKRRRASPARSPADSPAERRKALHVARAEAFASWRRTSPARSPGPPAHPWTPPVRGSGRLQAPVVSSPVIELDGPEPEPAAAAAGSGRVCQAPCPVISIDDTQWEEPAHPASPSSPAEPAAIYIYIYIYV